MNVFVIPSWYPSSSNPLNGIFVKEQVLAMSEMYEDINFGISTWGQNDDQFLLYSKSPISSLKKILKRHKPSVKKIRPNLEEYFFPAYSFTDKLFRGNIGKTIEANYHNFKVFENHFGKADVIHAHVCYKAGYIAQQISNRTNTPYVITEHMGPFPQKYHLTSNGNLRPHIKDAIEKSDALIAVSSDLKQVMKSYRIDHEIRVIPNFINLSPQNSASNKTDKFNFVTVSGMSFGKGIKELLQGIKKALVSESKMHFTLVGGGPALGQLKSFARSLNIEDNITWAGMLPKEKVGDYLAKADAHILVSHYDSFGVAYIEAMAYGIPSIAAAIGGPKDIIDHETGVLVKSVDPELIADNIIWMKNNYDSFDKKKIIQSFKSRFSTEAVAPKIRDLYQRVLR